MVSYVLSVGDGTPPDTVAAVADRLGRRLVAIPTDTAETGTRGESAPVVVVTDGALGELREAYPVAVLAYCPLTTEPGLVSDAVAAGADVVLPQDAADWGAATLERRIVDAHSALTASTRTGTLATDGGSPNRSTSPGHLVGPAEATMTVDAGGVVRGVDAGAAALLESTEARLVGSTVEQALPRVNTARFDDVRETLSPGDRPVSLVQRQMQVDRWLEFEARPTADGMVVAVRALDESERRRVVLDGIHGVTRRLFAATVPEAVAGVTTVAAREVLGLDIAVVRLLDDTTGKLPVASKTDAVDELMGIRPAYAVGEGLPGEVFETGDSRIHNERSAAHLGAVEASVHVPLGEYGVLSIGATESGVFTQHDLSLVKLLATTVTTALERTEREAQLRRRESVLESVEGMVFVLDEDRFIDYLTEPLARRLGVPRQEAVDRHVLEFIDIPALAEGEELVTGLSPDEGGSTLPLAIDPVDGESFPASVELSVLERTDDGEKVVGVVEDRSELAETKSDLERERERLWALFENLPDPVIEGEYIDGEPVVRSANDAFIETFGHPRSAIIDNRLDDVLAPPTNEGEDGADPEHINDRMQQGEVMGGKVRRETTEGTRTFLFRGIPYATNGTVHAFGIYTDVTDIERRERHAQVLDRLLRHNLRNDLGVVLGYAENIATRSDDPQVRAWARTLGAAAAELVDLSDTAKEIRRIIDSDEERTAGRVGGLLDTVAATGRERFPDATVRVAADVDPSLRVLGDGHLTTALLELVENAVTHGGNDATVSLEAAPVEGAADTWVDLRVVDDGPGIPDAERKAVTDERDITQLDHGSGLGLWLVRWAVEAVGGDLGFDDRSDETVVRVRLRRAD